MNNRRKLALAGLFAAILSLVFAPVVLAIVMDGYDTYDSDLGDLEWSAAAQLVSNDPDEIGITDNQKDVDDVYGACDSTTNNEIYFRIDTHTMPPSLASGARVEIYLDTDNNATTGCDDGTGFGNTGYEYYIEASATGAGTYECSGGTFPGLPNISAARALADILEISAPLGTEDIDYSCGNPMRMMFYYDGGTLDPDDVVPDDGNTTLVTLASFTAAATDGGVRIEWQTASEIDNAGFNLYRSDGGEYAKLNAALIPAQGGPTLGASYAYDDADVVPGTTYYYRLEDVDIYGQATLHGPVSVEVGEMPTAVEVHAFGASRAAAWLPTLALVFGTVGLAWTWRRKRR